MKYRISVESGKTSNPKVVPRVANPPETLRGAHREDNRDLDGRYKEWTHEATYTAPSATNCMPLMIQGDEEEVNEEIEHSAGSSLKEIAQ